METKLDGNYTRMLRSVLNMSWRQHRTKQQLYGYLPPIIKSSKLDEVDTQDTAEEVRTNSLAMYSCGSLRMDEQRLDDQLKPIFNNSVLIQGVAWTTYRERWTIETSAKEGQGNLC